jgi:ATP-dependent RNA helicase SUPV3L1/SUV3
MAERMARAAHEAIAKGEPFTASSPQIVSLGLQEDAFLQLMRGAGFRPVEAAAEGAANWAFRGRSKPRRRGRDAVAPPPPANGAFAGLAALLGKNG